MNTMKNLTLGILAHVDAGKTTTSEAILFKTGITRTFGRVDHKDAFLDNDRLEKQRGITIFSKQAIFDIGDTHVNLLDTPGHIDFSAEMERTLSVLDYAILVISAPDGVQAHTKTLLTLLSKYHIPTFIWVNKMDICQKSKGEILLDLSQRIQGVVDFTNEDKLFYESIAELDETALNQFISTDKIECDTIKTLIKTRKVFPCYFGSGLKITGVDEFLIGINKYTLAHIDMNSFGAKVYKITRDPNGNRLTHIKVTSGSIKVRELINDEKITQIRAYNGSKFETVEIAQHGNVYALLGLEKTYAGEGLGIEKNSDSTVLVPVLTYGIQIVDKTDPIEAYKKISVLAEEDPSLRIVWNAAAKQIQAQLMGKIQIEVLKEVIADRFGIDVNITTGKIIYRETIEGPVEGVGHFEPLRHYAEVHLLMEPLPYGSGIVFDSACSTDVLDLNWQRLILTNLAEKTHIGVLTGSPITDMRITVVAGRAHLKHTEGGDFRQATYRAVREGLRKAKNVLLEPFFDFNLEVPSSLIGRAISDLKAMGCRFDAPVGIGENVSISGVGPASTLSEYQTDLLSYTKGEGKLSCRYKGYYPCHNTEKVIEEIAYDPDRDIENTADSVFCSRGSGVNVPWYKVEEFMHIDSGIRFEDEMARLTAPKVKSANIDFDEKALEDIMLKEFGPIKRPQYSKVSYDSDEFKKKHIDIKKEHLIVDGYNVIYALDELKDLVSVSLDAAAMTLIDIIENYANFRNCHVTIVFDAYKVKMGQGSKSSSDLVNVVYTKEGESADFYIEKLIREIGKNYQVKVVTSDGMIQLAALRAGVMRMSSIELKAEIDLAINDINAILSKYKPQTIKFRDLIK